VPVKHNATGTARVLVGTEPDRTEVVAYYAWFMASVAIDDAPDRMRRGAGRYPQPVALLTRLGASVDCEGQGIGYGPRMHADDPISLLHARNIAGSVHPRDVEALA